MGEAQKNFHLLVVDDDPRLADLLARYLLDHGFMVSRAASSALAEKAMGFFTFDLLILDVMMPGESGVDFLKRLRADQVKIPVLMLTALGEVKDRIVGLQGGADDYLPKPFDPQELLLRVKSLLKRQAAEILTAQEFGPFRFDPDKRVLYGAGSVINLTENEKKILSVLLSVPDQVFSREHFIGILDDIEQERSVDVLMVRLRKKIEENPKKPLYLKTIRGKGYQLFIP